MALLSEPAHGTRETPKACAERLRISVEAAELFGCSDVIDLHVDSFIWQRLLGYDIHREHGVGPFGGRFFSQVDLPRFRRVGIDGATWVITTNPYRGAVSRREQFKLNLERLHRTLCQGPLPVRLVRNVSEFRAARAMGAHAAWLGIQGGNALDYDLDSLDVLADGRVVRVTLVHLSTSRIGRTSFSLAPSTGGLTAFGREVVGRLNELRVAVDLAHIDRKGFFDAVGVHTRERPFIVSHTGVCGVAPHWRNLDDEQLRAVADFGGVVGVMYHSPYLGDGHLVGHFRSSFTRVLDHIDHVIRTIGDEHVALGSDWDGFISPPRDMPTCMEVPRLVQGMLERGYSDERVRRVLGGNFLRVLADLRG